MSRDESSVDAMLTRLRAEGELPGIALVEAVGQEYDGPALTRAFVAWVQRAPSTLDLGEVLDVAEQTLREPDRLDVRRAARARVEALVTLHHEEIAALGFLRRKLAALGDAGGKFSAGTSSHEAPHRSSTRSRSSAPATSITRDEAEALARALALALKIPGAQTDSLHALGAVAVALREATPAPFQERRAILATLIDSCTLLERDAEADARAAGLARAAAEPPPPRSRPDEPEGEP